MPFGKCKICGKVVWGDICRECYRDQHESAQDLIDDGAGIEPEEE